MDDEQGSAKITANIKMKNSKALKAFKYVSPSTTLVVQVFRDKITLSAFPKNPSTEHKITIPYEPQNNINRSALYSLTFIFTKIFLIFSENVNLVGLTSISVSNVFSSFLYGDFPICVSERERVFLDGCVTTLFGLSMIT